jgi:hypothetical protein
MTPRTRFNFFIDAHQREALRRVKERDGIPESEQIRRAIDEWLAKRGEKHSDRRPVVSRKRRP